LATDPTSVTTPAQRRGELTITLELAPRFFRSEEAHMKLFFRMSLMAVVATGLVACGGGRGAKLAAGKENAAAALYQASSAMGGARGAMLSPVTRGITTVSGTETTVNCSLGGTATLTLDLTGIMDPNAAGEFAYHVKYNNCQEAAYDDPATTAVENEAIMMNGQMDISMKYNFTYTDTTADGEVEMHLKGRVDFTGAIADFIDADVSEFVTFSALSSTGGSVSLELEGTISISGGSYTYARTDGAIVIDAGTVAAAGDGT
jgi:hypothetical protein